MKLKSILFFLILVFAGNINANITEERAALVVDTEVKTLSSSESANSFSGNYETLIFLISGLLYFGIIFYKKKAEDL